jgi:hypothetical protein
MRCSGHGTSDAQVKLLEGGLSVHGQAAGGAVAADDPASSVLRIGPVAESEARLAGSRASLAASEGGPAKSGAGSGQHVPVGPSWVSQQQ